MFSILIAVFHFLSTNPAQKEGLTILHIAALHNDESMVRYLGGLDGLNANIQDRKHRTPLHIATERGNTRMMDYLVDKCKASLTYRTKVSVTFESECFLERLCSVHREAYKVACAL